MKLRKIFTIGQVWPEFVKRLPRTQPRYRIELSPTPPFMGLGQQLTDEQIRTFNLQQSMQQQYVARLSNNPLGVPASWGWLFN